MMAISQDWDMFGLLKRWGCGVGFR
jgi:hypothetical protein